MLVHHLPFQAVQDVPGGGKEGEGYLRHWRYEALVLLRRMQQWWNRQDEQKHSSQPQYRYSVLKSKLFQYLT